MAKPRPAAPSSRVFTAFGFATVIGLAIFAIWWFTSPPRAGVPAPPLERSTQPFESPAPPFGTSAPTTDASARSGGAPAPAESRLPRGGSLTGSTDDDAEAMARLTQATLVRVNRSTDEVEPWLAETWTASPDHLTYTLKLRPGILWSDGFPLTAEDASASIARIQVMGKPVAVRALDPLTIEIRFPEPFAPALRILDRHPILPRHKPSDGVGLGPFVVSNPRRRGPGPHTLVRNPRYWRTAPDGAALPYLDELTLAPGERGQHDFSDSAIPPDEYEALKALEQSGKARLFDLGPGLDAAALWISSAPPGAAEKPWLASEAFRLAISAAVDRRAYCKQVFFGACDPISGPVTPANASWFNPDLPLGPGNAQVARAMLAELGLLDRTGDGMLDDATRRPVRFSLLIRGDVASSVRAAAFLTDTLRAVGIGVVVTPLDAAALRARRMKGNYDAIYDRIEVRDTDPAMNLDFWLSSGEAHVWKPARQTSPFDWERQIDQLMLKHAASFDRVERLQAFAEVQRLYSQHMPAVFFGAPRVRLVTSTRVLNATPSPVRPHLLWNAENLAALTPETTR